MATMWFVGLCLMWLGCQTVNSCLPGRPNMRFRRPDRAPPFVFKQYSPNVAETAAAASGPSKGRVKRGDDRFAKLVANYNPDVEFKDEEGTGEDRMMSRRCKEKLDNLAMLVMNQWPGTKLRVTEAWDEHSPFAHASNSLHGEGRAVDITTDDKDKSKYGHLARLAVHAGFDWVFYENRAHIHASVKPDTAESGRIRGCFSLNGRVRLEDGNEKSIADLQVNDRVLSVTSSGRLVYSPVVLILDHSTTDRVSLVDLYVDAGDEPLSVTPFHLVYRQRHVFNISMAEDLRFDFSQAEAVFGHQLVPGDMLALSTHATDSGEMRWARLSRTEWRNDVGYAAPLTAEGTIVVNRIAASCYAAHDNEDVMHAAMAPVRWWHALAYQDRGWFAWLTSLRTPTPRTGIHWYARTLHWIGRFVLGFDLT